LEAKMRRLACLAIVLTCGAAAGARAADSVPVARAEPPARTPLTLEAPSISDLLDKASADTDALPVDWRASEVGLSPKAALRIRIADPATTRDGRPLQTPAFDGGQAYEFSVVRDWPAAVSFNRFGMAVTPHAGVGVTSSGGMAEAGDTLQFGQRVDAAVKEKLGAMGVGDGRKFGDKGRWYVFAAASGRSVGLNMLRSDAGWARAGWTTDQSSTLVGDAQVGVGWRKGDMQSSVGFVHREIKGLHTLYGVDTKADSLVAFTFSVRPER
jgi:hypothetical protein